MRVPPLIRIARSRLRHESCRSQDRALRYPVRVDEFLRRYGPMVLRSFWLRESRARCPDRDDGRLGPAASPGFDGGGSWRHRLLAVVTSWNRYQVGRVIEGVILTWLIGDGGALPGRGAGESGIRQLRASRSGASGLVLFGGLDDSYRPQDGDRAGHWPCSCWSRGSGWPGYSRRAWPRSWSNATCGGRDVSHFEMDDHLVLCNWAPRGLEWIREVHSKIITDPRPIVIIHDNPDEIDLPDKQDEPAFNDVYIVKGDPTNEVILHRATVPKAYSVIVLSRLPRGEARRRQVDPDLHRDPPHLQGRAPAEHRRRVPQPRQPLPPAQGRRRARSSRRTALGLRLLARSALFHGMSAVLPGAAHRPPRRQRGVPGAGPRGAGRPLLRRTQRAVPPLPRATAAPACSSASSAATR